MNFPKWLPRPAAWASGVALYVFASLVRITFVFAMPFLVALMRHWPRLAWVSLLLLWLSPIAGAAAIHNFSDRLLRANKRAAPEPRLTGAASWWAGFVAWATIIVVSFTVALVAVALDPPPIVDPESLSSAFVAVTSGATTARSILWVLLAACVYELEARTRKRDLPAQPAS